MLLFISTALIKLLSVSAIDSLTLAINLQRINFLRANYYINHQIKSGTLRCNALVSQLVSILDVNKDILVIR